MWRESLTVTQFSIARQRDSLTSYGYSDGDEGGGSSIIFAPGKPLQWQCRLRAGVRFPYCAYGLHYPGQPGRRSMDLSGYHKAVIDLDYRGPPGRMRLTLKNFDPAYSRAGKDDSTMPVGAEFDVRPGRNHVVLSADEFGVDSWWLERYTLPASVPMPDTRHVIAIDFVSAGMAVPGSYSVRVDRLDFEGILLSETQWYLLLIGFWATLAGGLLVRRFLAVRRAYEVEQQNQALASAALAEARTAAEAASLAKSRFLANMSHELRTPLNAILGYTQLLQREQLGPRQRSAVETIHQSGTHLLTLITDILDLSKIEAGKLEVLPAPVALRACIDQVGAMMRLRAEEKGLDFQLAIDADVPAMVTVDEKRLRQIMLNLIGNAIRFTSAGGVRLDISVAGWGDGGVRLRLDVTDSGVGIASEQLERIFLPFEQAGGAIDRSGGTGLGLSITRQIVAAMRGEVTVESTPGMGSRFRVEIECGLAALGTAAPAAAPLRLAGTVRALVVDDDPASAALLGRFLESQGFTVTTAGDGLAALEAARLAWPRLILMDLKMPVMGGCAAIRRLKADPMLRDVPVVVISGRADAAAEAEAVAAGAVRLLPKPVDLDKLSACLTGLFAPSPPPPPAEPGMPELIAPPPEQLDRLLDLARAGDMRAIRREAESIAAQDPLYRPFADRLAMLAAGYQSPQVLRLIEAKIGRSPAA